MTPTDRLGTIATFLLDLIAVWSGYLLVVAGIAAVVAAGVWVRERRAYVRAANARRAAARQAHVTPPPTRMAS